MKKIKKVLREIYSLNILAITIAFILAFDSAGYCLRVPVDTSYERIYKASNQVFNDQWMPLEDFNKGILLNKSTGRVKLAEEEPAVNIEFDLWLVRHGETEGNVIKGIFQGAVDEEINQLNRNGRKQARDAAKALFKNLSHKAKTGDVVVMSSRFARAKDMAKNFARLIKKGTGLDIPILEEELAAEMSFGVIDNKIPDQLTDEQRAFVARYRQGLDATAVPEGGENFINVLSRSRDLLIKLNKLYKGKTVVLFGHGIQTSAIRALLGDKTLLDASGQIDWREKMIPNGSSALFTSNDSDYISEIIKYDINISNKKLFEGRCGSYLLNMAKHLETLAGNKMGPVRLARVYMMLADLYSKYLPDKYIDKEKSAMYERLASEKISKIIPLNNKIRRNVKIPKELYNSECVVTVPARIELGSGLGSDLTGISYGEGGISLNIAVDVEGHAPSEIRVKRIDDLIIRLISVDKDVTEVLFTKEDALNHKGKTLNLARACLIESGIIKAEDPRELREILKDFGGGIEITTTYKLDKKNGNKMHAGGLGGSSNLAAGILKALYTFSGQEVSNQEITKAIVRVESMLELGGGWQDGVGGVYGGVKLTESRENRINPVPRILPLTKDIEFDLEKRLILFYSGEERSVSGRKDLLNHNIVSYLARNIKAMTARENAKKITIKMARALNSGNISELGRLVGDYWQWRLINKPSAQTEFIKRVMDTVKEEGLAEGYNSTGAGGGGCYVFIAREGKEDALRKRLNELGMEKGGRVLGWSINKTGISVSVNPLLTEHDYELPLKDFRNLVSSDRPGFGVERNIMAEYSLWARAREILDKLRVGEEPDIVLDEIEIQPDSVCNMRCSHCRREFLNNNGTVKISEDNMIHIVQSVIDHNKSHPGPKIRKIRFSGFTGEPLMNKKALLKGMELAKKAGLSVGLFTNGALLNDEARKAVVENASYVHVSLDAGSEESMKIIKRRGGFEKIIENIRELAALRAKQKSSVGITVGYILHRPNIPEIYNAVRMLKDAGADMIRFNIDIYRAKRDGLLPDEIEAAYDLIDKAKRDFEDEKFKVVILHQKDEAMRPAAEESNTGAFETCYFSRLVNVIGDDSASYACYHIGRLPDEDPRKYGATQGVDYLKLYRKGHTRWASRKPADYCELCPAQGYRTNVFLQFLRQSEKDYPGFLDYIERAYVIPAKAELAEKLAASGRKSSALDLYDEIAYLYYKHGYTGSAYAAIDKRNSLLGQGQFTGETPVLFALDGGILSDETFKKDADIAELILRHENFTEQLRNGKLRRDIDVDPNNIEEPLLDWVNHAETALLRGGNELDEISNQAELLRERYKFFIFTGMGGSVNPIKTLGDNEGNGIYALDSTTTESTNEVMWKILKAYDPDSYEKAKKLASRKNIGGESAELMDLFKPALAKTLVVCLGKTGSTKEVAVNRDFFIGIFRQSGLPYQEHMTVMGDPGNFQNQASELGIPFQAAAVLGRTHNPDRFGLITSKFLLPLALSGREPKDVLDKSLSLIGAIEDTGADNPFIRLASILYTCAVKGDNKITLILPEKLQPLAEHIEQMFEESLGKDGKGFHVFYGEPEDLSLSDGSNRVFFYLSYEGMPDEESRYFDGVIARLKNRPVVRMQIASGDETVARTSFMLGLQRTIAAIGYLWDINFVTQDAVQRYKEIGKDLESNGNAKQMVLGSPSHFESLTLYKERPPSELIYFKSKFQDAADTMRSTLDLHIVDSELSEGSVYPFVDIAFYGRPSLEMKFVLSEFRNSIMKSFGIPVKETVGLGRNHAIHQAEVDGPQGGLSIYIIPLSHPDKGFGGHKQGDSLNLNYALSAAEAVRSTGRQVVIITIPEDNIITRSDLITFIKKATYRYENRLENLLRAPANQSL